MSLPVLRRRGPKALPIDDDLRARLQRYADQQGKSFAAAAELGISLSTLNRMLSGRSQRVAVATLRSIHRALGMPDNAATTVSTSSADEEMSRSRIIAAMHLDARGDSLAAARLLSTSPPGDADPAIGVCWRIVSARNALALGHTERAESLFASVLPFLKTCGNQAVLLARTACELAAVHALRGKVADALLAFDLAESTLAQPGNDAAPFLMQVRQAYLAYALRIGKRDVACRLLEEELRLLQGAEGDASIAATIDGWLLDQVRHPGVAPDHF